MIKMVKAFRRAQDVARPRFGAAATRDSILENLLPVERLP
jgi:hypothetical protein